MATPVIVRKVENKADFKAFFEFPWTLYKNDPNWVPPLLSMRRDLLDKKKNPSWEYLEGDYYVAWRGQEPVGTIAAFINHHHNAFHNEHIAWFGFFETVNDADVANALLGAAIEWAKARDYNTVRGPQSFTVMDECGLLIDGFTRPVLLMPYNPPYYQTLIENSPLGFHKVMDLVSVYLDREMYAGLDLGERLNRLMPRIQERQRITIRGFNPKTDFEVLRSIYNSAWERNWGFTPFTPAELDALVKHLGQFLDPKLGCLAFVKDEPVAFLLAVPDLSQVLHRAYARPGVPEAVTLVKALWHWKVRSCINWVRVALMGIKEGHRGQGIDLAMYHFLVNTILNEYGDKYQYMDAGWVWETNKEMLLAVTKAVGAKIYKTYRYYEQSSQP